MTGRAASCDEELLALDGALEELARLKALQAEIVEKRSIGGRTGAETAAALGVSES